MVRGFNLFGGGIKSVQHGSIYSAQATITANIGGVDLGKSVVYAFTIPQDNNATPWAVLADFNSDTQIKLDRVGGSDTTIYWVVIEFENVKSLQQGIVSQVTENYAIGVSAWINNVDTTKSLIYHTHKTSQTNTNTQGLVIAGHFNGNDRIDFSVRQYNDMTIKWFVVEFN